MRVVAFGDLYTDYYFNNNSTYLMGGKTNANIICNLAKNIETAFIGTAGNDIQGKICTDSLKELNVDTKINIINNRTKMFFNTVSSFTKICPICNKNHGYNGTKFNKNDLLNYINKEDYIVIDNLSNETLSAIENINNPIFLDCGYTKCFKNKSIIEVKKSFNKNYKIVNFNERVIKYLEKHYNFTCLDIYNIIQPELMIITKGKRGSTLIYNGFIQEKTIETPTKEIDPSGAGDAFFSEFIKEYLNSGCDISENMIKNAYKNASSLSSKVVRMLGARTHLQKMYKLENYDNCICDSKIIVKKGTVPFSNPFPQLSWMGVFAKLIF